MGDYARDALASYGAHPSEIFHPVAVTIASILLDYRALSPVALREQIDFHIRQVATLRDQVLTSYFSQALSSFMVNTLGLSRGRVAKLEKKLTVEE
jgi:hypothetical protein